MKVLLFSQNDNFFLVEEKAWNQHIQMIRLNLLQEEGESQESVEEVLTDYLNSFQREELSLEESSKIEKNYQIKINKSKKINSTYGDILLF